MCNTKIGTAIQGILGFYVFIGIILAAYAAVNIFPVDIADTKMFSIFAVFVLAVAVMVNPLIGLINKFQKK